MGCIILSQIDRSDKGIISFNVSVAKNLSIHLLFHQAAPHFLLLQQIFLLVYLHTSYQHEFFQLFYEEQDLLKFKEKNISLHFTPECHTSN